MQYEKSNFTSNIYNFSRKYEKYHKKVTKENQIEYNDTKISYTDEYLWLLSCKEIYNSTIYGNEGRQYKYYKNNSVECIQKTTSNYSYWWLRTLNIPYSNGFCAAHNTNRNIVQANATEKYEVAPRFSI